MLSTYSHTGGGRSMSNPITPILQVDSNETGLPLYSAPDLIKYSFGSALIWVEDLIQFFDECGSEGLGLPEAQELLNETIEKMLLDGQSINSIAKQLGYTRSHLQAYVKKQGLVKGTGGVSVHEKQEHELKQLRAKVRSVRKVDVANEVVLDEIRDAIQAAEPKFPRLPRAAGGSGTPHVQTVLVSDLHGGEVVLPEAVDGMNEYNWEHCTARMADMQKSLISYKENRPYDIEELQVWFLGDMCSGTNHAEITETNEFSAAEQGYKVGILLGKWVEQLVPHYPKIKVIGVPGNHPRVPQAPANKQVFNNFDWMAYKIAEVYLGNYESVSCTFPEAGMHVAEVAGRNILLFHGDGIRSSMPGVPWGGVVRRGAALKAQYAQHPTKPIFIDGFALGHFHQSGHVGGVFMNGSIKGPDEYSMKQFGTSEQPTQLLLTWNPRKRRLTDVSYINPEG
jgi:hypothetical protein